MATTVAPAGGTCAGKPCWKPSGAGFKYGDKELTPDGLSKISLKPGAAAKAKISVGGKSTNLPMPALPLTTPVKVQLGRSDGALCWETTFSSAKTNQADRFSAKSD